MEKVYFVEMVLSDVRKTSNLHISIDSNVFLCSHSQVAVFQLCEDINMDEFGLGFELSHLLSTSFIAFTESSQLCCSSASRRDPLYNDQKIH